MTGINTIAANYYAACAADAEPVETFTEEGLPTDQPFDSTDRGQAVARVIYHLRNTTDYTGTDPDGLADLHAEITSDFGRSVLSVDSLVDLTNEWYYGGDFPSEHDLAVAIDAIEAALHL